MIKKTGSNLFPLEEAAVTVAASFKKGKVIHLEGFNLSREDLPSLHKALKKLGDRITTLLK